MGAAPGRQPSAADWKRHMDAMRVRFERRCRDRPSVLAECGLAGRRLSLHAWSPNALESVIRPVANLRPPREGAPRLSVEIFEGPDPVLEELWPAPAAACRDGTVRPRLVLGDGETTFGAAWPVTGMMALLERRPARATVWLREPERIGVADAATIIRALAAWWMADSGAGVVHAAAVVGTRGAALLAGRGGTGKSSTAAACFIAGLGFIGDDSVFCRTEPTEVLSLNTWVSLFEDDLALHYAALDGRARTRPGRDGKVVVDLATVERERIAESAPICAIVSLVRSESAPPGLRRADRARVLASLAPSSVFNVPTLGRNTLSMITALVRRLPTYELVLRGDREEAAAHLHRLLQDGVPS